MNKNNTSKTFNTEGPCLPHKNYMIPALNRLLDVEDLISNEKYFVLQAPRQSGKTTCIQALVSKINKKGDYYALYYSLETLRNINNPIEAGISFVDSFNQNLRRSSENALNSLKMDSTNLGRSVIVSETISTVCKKLRRPLVLFFDEADALPEEFIIPFLSQLRDGYINRSQQAPFPISIALIGLRPISEYKYKVRDESKSIGSASPFNVVRPLTLANFNLDEVKALYNQHTEATGQVFENEAIKKAWYWTEGQPWLVNALAQQIIEKDLKKDYSQPVTVDCINVAAENLILSRDTHIDSLLARLREPRIERVMTPIFIGGIKNKDTTPDDTQLCLDLGLIKRDKNKTLCPSNPIYKEVMIRYLTFDFQDYLQPELVHQWMDDQAINITDLLKGFQQFWRENSEIWIESYKFNEAGPHFSLQGFLQKVINGGAKVTREYALGRSRVDLCIDYKNSRYLIELKIKDNTTKNRAIEQLTGYMDKAGVKESWLMIFDSTPGKLWDEKISWETLELENGYTIHLIGC